MTASETCYVFSGSIHLEFIGSGLLERVANIGGKEWLVLGGAERLRVVPAVAVPVEHGHGPTVGELARGAGECDGEVVRALLVRRECVGGSRWPEAALPRGFHLRVDAEAVEHLAALVRQQHDFDLAAIHDLGFVAFNLDQVALDVASCAHPVAAAAGPEVPGACCLGGELPNEVSVGCCCWCSEDVCGEHSALRERMASGCPAADRRKPRLLARTMRPQLRCLKRQQQKQHLCREPDRTPKARVEPLWWSRVTRPK
ncbi:hypothetical protein PybrP1_003852 [[Pythium] brassicae (nom. inval.)]|nr:hypothetical protein PybrP1_003852 [[Pythium] brassicae (nom. inval.)]